MMAPSILLLTAALSHIYVTLLDVISVATEENNSQLVYPTSMNGTEK
jgi:hypothetical protein